MEPVELLVIGGSGLVGRAVITAARDRTRLATYRFRAPRADGGGDPALIHAPLDVTDAEAVRALVARSGARVVVNAAISTRPEDALAVCVAGAAHVAAAARATGAALVHLSSDMVFDGASGPYDEDRSPSPITPYGAAKADAERLVRAAHPAAVIARLPLLYSLDPLDRGLATWLAGARAGAPYPLFVDELRRPAHAGDVGVALARLARALAGDALLPPPPPVVHLPGPRTISRHAFGTLVLAALGLPAEWAVPGHAADAAPPRPRELVLIARRTPAPYLEPLRAPEEALRGAVTRSPAPPTTSTTPPAGR
jgi:dTDP-4-dehydrorhamnose reductase